MRNAVLTYPPSGPGPPLAPPDLGWRTLRPKSVESLSVFLTVLFFLSLPLAALITESGGDVIPGMIALIACRVFLGLFLRASRLPAEDRAWVVSLCQTSLLLRALLAVLIYYGPWDRYALSEDQVGYDFLPQIMVRYWRGEIPEPPFLHAEAVAERFGYYRLVTAQYYIFGPSLLVPRMFNALAGALLVFYSWRLASYVFGRTAGKVAAVWATFFPSLLLWSALNMRDIWLALSILAIVWHSLLLRDRFYVTSTAVIVAHLVWIQYNRPYLVLIMIAAIAGIFFFARSQRFGREIVVGVFVVGLLVTLHNVFGLGREGLEWLDLEKIASRRETLARGSVGQSGYLGDVDLSRPEALIVFIPVGVVYFLFSPFPWEMTAIRRVMTLPEMLVWYWSFPFVWVAARQVWRERTGRRLALLLPTLGITLAFAISSSNLGLAYRYRAQIVALYLAFAAAGYVQRRAPHLAA